MTASKSAPSIDRVTQEIEVVGVLIHEFNDFLNGVILHMSLLEQRLPADLQPQAAEIHRQASEKAQLIKQWYQYRSPRRHAVQPLALPRILRAVAHELAGEWAEPARPLKVVEQVDVNHGMTRSIRLDLDDNLPAIAGYEQDVRSICFLLLKNLAAANRNGQGLIIVRLEAAGEHVQLHLEDPGADIPPEHVPYLFDKFLVNAVNSLELLACKNMLRRQGAKIRAENRPTGGIAITVSFPLYRGDRAS